MKKIIVPFECSTAGDATVTAERDVLGKLFAIEYQFGTADATADFVITCEGIASKPLLTESLTNSNAWRYPRDVPHKTEDGAALTATAGGDRVQPLLAGKIQVVCAQGGTSKKGRVIFYYDE